MKELIHKMPKWLWVCLTVLAFTVIGWKLAFPTNSFRYKVTVNVETPEGLKSGSAVREVVVKRRLSHTRSINFVRGEAVVVDLGTRGKLFAVVDPDDEYLVFNTFPIVQGGFTRAGVRHYERLEAKAVVDTLNYPLLVAFKDIEDPKTVTVAYRPLRERDADKLGMQYKLVGVENNMAKLFGSGVHLKDIEIEMTKTPVTWNVQSHLPWLLTQRKKGGTFSGQTFFETVPSPEKTLTAANFIQGK